MKTIQWLTLPFVSIFLIQCSTSPQKTEVCTQEFITYPIAVLGADGEPADSVQIQVTNEETGQIYNICSEEQNVCAGGNNGRYTIMHDGFHGKISTEGEDILVSGEKGQLQFQAKYTFRSGECHLQKLAGPDTVSLSKK
ncbi:MAG TPA: hypothetical protein VK112_05460 [Fodinibius sp.]|nr:hypothetical protein [Fodinibius sp.]